MEEHKKKYLINGSLADRHPKIAAFWHSTKNGALSPKDVSAYSTMHAWWKCPDCNYEWQAYVSTKAKKNTGCPQCTSLFRHAKGKAHEEWPINLIDVLKGNDTTLTITEEHLSDVMQMIDLDKRKIILQRYEEHLTITKMAEMNGCSKQAIHSKIRASEKKLRYFFEKNY